MVNRLFYLVITTRSEVRLRRTSHGLRHSAVAVAMDGDPTTWCHGPSGEPLRGSGMVLITRSGLRPACISDAFVSFGCCFHRLWKL